MLHVRPERMFLLELRRDDIRDGRKYEDPSRVKIDRDAENFADA